jgi:hypothetical protein
LFIVWRSAWSADGRRERERNRVVMMINPKTPKTNWIPCNAFCCTARLSLPRRTLTTGVVRTCGEALPTLGNGPGPRTISFQPQIHSQCQKTTRVEALSGLQRFLFYLYQNALFCCENRGCRQGPGLGGAETNPRLSSAHRARLRARGHRSGEHRIQRRTNRRFQSDKKNVIMRPSAQRCRQVLQHASGQVTSSRDFTRTVKSS